MNPNLNEPKAWMQINFSSLLSKSQSFDEVSYRKAKRMRLFYDQKSVCDELKEKQSPLNLDPTAVVDLYNNPAGYYLNQVNPVNDISPMPDSDMSSPLRVKDLIDEEWTDQPVNCFEDPANPVLIINEELSYVGPSATLNDQYVDLSPIAYQFLLPMPKSSDLDATLSADVPVGFDCSSELKRIYFSRKYSGFKDFLTTLKKIYPFIEQIKSIAQIKNWFYYYHYSKPIRVDCGKKSGKDHNIRPDADVEVVDTKEGFDYQKELQAEYDTGKYGTPTPFLHAIIAKFPFILKLKTKKQILNWYNGKKYATKKHKVDDSSIVTSAAAPSIASSENFSDTSSEADFMDEFQNSESDEISKVYACHRPDLPTSLTKNAGQNTPKKSTLQSTHALGGSRPLELKGNRIRDKSTIAEATKNLEFDSQTATVPQIEDRRAPSLDLSEYHDFFNTPAMQFLDSFFEETLFG